MAHTKQQKLVNRIQKLKGFFFFLIHQSGMQILFFMLQSSSSKMQNKRHHYLFTNYEHCPPRSTTEMGHLIGIERTALSWFRFSLSDCSQFVHVNDEPSLQTPKLVTEFNKVLCLDKYYLLYLCLSLATLLENI